MFKEEKTETNSHTPILLNIHASLALSVTVALMSVQPIPIATVTMDNILVIDEAIQQQFEEIAVRRLIRKLDWRIIPFMVLIEVISYMNRISTGHVKLMGIESDLNLSQSESNWHISLFFLAYLIFAIPSNILMRYLGATRHLSLSMLAWGSITVGLAFVRNAQQLLSVKFLLGMTQAGFFPSIVIYFSLWYCKRDQTMRIAILFGAAIISSALSGILAYGFTHLDGTRGLNSWQWTFLLEGLPMIPLGIITCLFLSNIPDTVQWLNNSEK
ncbi:unnamed protein product [Rotaria sordida]|uniref:Major facilitator superfamily (MFS) profile domain-containing protein n=1 Tax=Rotaria sordida TaxID=392033 RepID=A0A815TQR9_9BILA|nr:unnamed protein product [Rotaria sordida]CAF1511786.1 unnamed protein product [Rotaria sordida]